MNLHTHGHDDCALTGKITMGDFDCRYLFTTGYLGWVEVKASAWAHLRSDSYRDAWSMQEPASFSMHIICMDVHLATGNTMLLYATRVHHWHA